MKSLCTLLFSLSLMTLFGQQFTPITEGSIVNTRSDSRSCNFIDLNGDFLDDIFISNGPSTGENNMLYLNENGTFKAVTNDPIVEDNGKSDGATFGDVDNDGYLDVFVVTWYGQRNFFYRNNGDNTFTFEGGTANFGGTFSETAAFGDYDRDGWLDLYVTNSTNFTTNTDAIKRNQLWHNTRDGKFERITTGEWVRDANISRSVQWIDYDQDGDTDLWISNEENEPNYLYENEGDTFTKRTDIGLNNLNRSSTGSSWGDVDNDGDLDLFIANFSNQRNQLFFNNGAAGFQEDFSSVIREPSCSFGSAFADFDNDGDLDLFVTNGFCDGEIQNFLYQNDGKGNFTKDESSIPDLSTNCSFGAAWGDMNGDGYLDLVIANCKGNAVQSPNNTLLRNNGGDNNFIKFHLEGVQSNRSAIGAIVRVKADIGGEAIWQMRAISGQSGYNGQNSLTVHFGLANAEKIDSVLIEWPSGQRDTLTELAVREIYSITETPTSQVVKASNLLPIQLHVFPNPTTATQLSYQIKGEFNLSKDSYLQILGVDGREKWSTPITQRNDSLSINELVSGIYFIRLRQGEKGSTLVRFSVQR